MDLATGALGSLLPKLVQLLDDEYKRLKGLRKDVEFLERELRSIHAALRKVAEVSRDQLDDQVRLWATEVRELSYNMEDVVDRFLVCVEGSGDPVERSHKLKRLMKKMAGLVTEGKTRHQIVDAIKDIKGQVEDVAARRDRYRIDDIVANPNATTTVDPRLLAMYKDQNELVGIKEASVELINRLADGNSDVSMQHLKILSILGFGGLGKTTLAKAVYDGFKGQFECMAFVSVGRKPNLKKLVKNILLELDKQKYMSFNESMLDERQLIDELRGLLQNKRYFIVIDDIWDTPTWEIVKCAFVDSNHGSRIVTTTRIFEVAATANDVYKMEPLSNENSEELFHKRLFGGKYKYPDNQPAELFEKILHKCGGVPLAIITIASLLASKPCEEWPMVYNSIGFGYGDNKEVENMRKILLFSYYDLPCYLRTCLLYLSIYPEDYEIKKDILIWKWVAEGFVQEEPRRGLFEVGERYFNEVINRSMIQPLENIRKSSIYGCRVHDMVLDMICLLSGEENFVTIYDREEQNTSSKIHPRRLATKKRDTEHNHLDNMHTPQVRSFNVTMCRIRVMPSLSGFEALRVLAIENCSLMKECRFRLENLGRLHQLRYLGLRDTPIGELPKEIGDLKFLQTIDLWGTGIKALPQSVILLRQLKCLRACNYYMPISVPDGMGNLTSLEELALSRVINSPNFVIELGKLTELRNLHICIELPEIWMCKAIVEYLGNMQKIQVLFLDVDEAKLNWEGYAPPPQLRYLSLHQKFSRLPTWINSSLLPNLVHLEIYLSDAVEAPDLVTLGKFPELLCLEIYGPADDISVVMGGDAFPRLSAYLGIIKAHELSSWRIPYCPFFHAASLRTRPDQSRTNSRRRSSPPATGGHDVPFAMLRLRSCVVLTHLLSSPATYPSKNPVSCLHRLLSTAAAAVLPNPSFAVEDYLVETCGLTRAQALKASGKISHLKSPSKPDAVLAFLDGLGFSGTDIATLVARDPKFLCARVEITLAPIAAGLTSLGLSHSEIAHLVSLAPSSFRRTSIVSKVQYYLLLFGSYKNLLRATKRGIYHFLSSDLENQVKPTTAFLRECGLSACDIAKLCIAKPRMLTTNLESVQMMVACAEGLGVPRGSGMFRHMLHVLASLSEENIAVKVEYMKTMFGWTDAHVGIAVSKAPLLLVRSKDTLQSRSEFLISEVGLEPSYIAHVPALISYSLEGRLRPRYYVMKFLKENGLIDHDRSYFAAVTVTEKFFVEKYICPHNEAAPYLAEDYATACRGEVPTRFIFA